jgi:hypothetical protein
MAPGSNANLARRRRRKYHVLFSLQYVWLTSQLAALDLLHRHHFQKSAFLLAPFRHLRTRPSCLT